MTKVKLKDATKELLNGADEVLGQVSGIKKGADELMQAARKLEAQFQREEEMRRMEELKAEQERLTKQHTKAFTMPDADEIEVEEPKENSADASVKEISAESEKPKQHSSAAQAAETGESRASQEDKPERQKPAEAVKEPVSTVDSVSGSAEAADLLSSTTQPSVSVQARPVVQPQSSANVRSVVQPQQGTMQARSAAPGGRTAAPAMKQAYQANQATPQQGAYGRPANPQGSFGRPANPQGPYGRPANPQGPYGRPANPQGPYGRPANSQGQGSYGRPAVSQGNFARPAGAPQGGSGGYARPAAGGQRPAGGFGRPMGGGGGQGAGYGRPAGGPGGGYGRSTGGAGGRAKPAEIAPVMEKERVSNYDPNKKNYQRQHDNDRVSRNRKQLARESFSGYDDEVVRGGRRARAKRPSAQQLMAPIKIEKAYMTAETITVKDLTERIGKPAGDILKKLLLLGVMANINSELDFDTAGLVASEFGVEMELNIAKTAEDVLIDTDFEDADEDLVARPPVVTIMGHVDHGKTSLLDYIRNTKVTSGEAGGITQHIGAYTVSVDDQKITFLDTPGHEAFTAMRARGAQSTDIAILVVAADDGVMPQTVEAINHAKAADVPIIVAINKMDKESANPERVKQDLTAHGLIPEEWGGDTIIAPVSAVTGEGVDGLLEMVLLVADMRQLRANPNRMAKGIIIEAKLDKARGPVATVLLQNGTLHIGDNIVAGMASGRVRAMVNDRGERVNEAGPSMPVEIAGFNEVPSAGDDMMVVEDDHLGRQVAQERRNKVKAARISASAKVSLDNLFSHIDQGKLVNLNIVIKADVQGSVEAVKQALEKLSNEEVRVRVLHSGVGSITKDDVNLASAFGAIIIGFNIRPDNSARDAADKEGVDIRLYRVIYQAIEDIEKAMKGLLAPEFKEVLLGHAEVRSTFRITGAGTVAGCYVTDGKMQRNADVRLLRDHVVVFEGKLSSLKRFKDDAKEVATGYECGVSFDAFNDIKEGDVVECFLMEEIER